MLANTNTLTRKRLTKYTEALGMMSLYARSYGKERIMLDDADGRILAENIVADRDYPPYSRAALEGYAIRKSDWDSGLREYRIQDELETGFCQVQELEEGYCYKVKAGAAVPGSVDAIIAKADALELPSGVVVVQLQNLRYNQNISLQGEDVFAHEVIVPRHTRCCASVIGALASVGKKTVMVEKLPQVALFTTGNELVAVGAPVSKAKMRNSNKHLLLSLLRKWNIKPTLTQHLPDDKKALAEALQNALEHDIVLINGGLSNGDAEWVPPVLEELGVEVVFHKVAIKPGSTVFFGRLPKGGVVFALPGNPFSCLVTFTLFVEDYLFNCFGLQQPLYHSPLLEQREKAHEFTEFFPVRIDILEAGVRPLEVNGSGNILAGVGAHGLGVHPAGQEVLKRGFSLNIIPFSNFSV